LQPQLNGFTSKALVMKLLLSVLLILIVSIIYSQEWKTYPSYQTDSHICFPEDEGVHFDEPTEWWYLVGHVYGETSGDYYTIMLTYFYYPYQGLDGFRIFNLTNETKNIFSPQVLAVMYDFLAEDSLFIVCNPIGAPNEMWKNQVDSTGIKLPFQYEAFASQDNGSIELFMDTFKKPLIVGDSGFFFQGGGDNYTYYYSQTGINLTGTITFSDVTEKISGVGWIDRQYGLFNPYSNEAYEWFSVQLSNGADLNIWNIFTADHQIPDTSTFILCSMYIDDSTNSSFHDFTLERLQYAYMPDSVNCYSQKWNFKYEDIDLTFNTHDPYREVDIPIRFYEGAIEVTGIYNGEDVTGVGFAELLHSYEKPELDFVNPDTIVTWIGEDETISWNVLNPDDANPLYYNLSYSIDGGETIEEIKDGITDTAYFWEFKHLNDSSVIIFQLTGASIDKTLSHTIYSDEVTVIFPNSTDDNPETSQETVVFPNPTNGVLTIRSNNVRSIQLFDINGRFIRDLWKNKGVVKDEITADLSGEENGVYYLKIQHVNRTMVQKIILNSFD